MTIAVGSNKDVSEEVIIDTLVEVPVQLHVARERVSEFDRPGSIGDTIREYEERLGVGRSDAFVESEEVLSLTRTARTMGYVAIGMGLGGLASGGVAGLSIDKQLSALPPEAGVAVLGCSAVLVGTIAVWCRDRLGRSSR